MMGRIALLVCAAVLACACADRRAEPLRRAGHAPVKHASKPRMPPDAGTNRTGGRDSGAMAQHSGSGGDTAPHVPDAGKPPTKPPVVNDAATADASMPDAQISTPACDPKQCPDPAVLDVPHLPDPWVACCTSDGACGLNTADADDWMCAKIDPGQNDPSCLDIVIDGKTIEGCCREDGKCGHVDPVLGCHQLYNDDWSGDLTECGVAPTLVPTPPNPFECIFREDPCTEDWQCCQHYNYGTQCSDPFNEGHKYCNHCPEC